MFFLCLFISLCCVLIHSVFTLRTGVVIDLWHSWLIAYRPAIDQASIVTPRGESQGLKRNEDHTHNFLWAGLWLCERFIFFRDMIVYIKINITEKYLKLWSVKLIKLYIACLVMFLILLHETVFSLWQTQTTNEACDEQHLHLPHFAK